MDLSNSELIDAGLETPVNKENLTEDEKLLMEKDEKINASEPWSAERSVLLQEAVQFHQDKLIEEIKELENVSYSLCVKLFQFYGHITA